MGSKFSITDNKHGGIDIVAKQGAPIKASASGLVVFSGWTYEMGNLIIIHHGDGYFTHYGHNQQNFKYQLDIVKRGEVIGLVGDTGISSGPHLHFEIWKDKQSIDPLNYFPEYKQTDLTSSNG
jgi:murein DD-endopeptidase MepM/ murein hydrolase activator NlpD